MHLAQEGRLLEGFDHVRARLDRYLDACFALEVIQKMFSPADPHPAFLRGALSYLKLLSVSGGRRALRVHFHSRLLLEAGFCPDWGCCCECGEVVEGDGLALRLPDGLLCCNCRRESDGPISGSVVRYLQQDRELSWGNVPAFDPGVEVLRGKWPQVPCSI